MPSKPFDINTLGLNPTVQVIKEKLYMRSRLICPALKGCVDNICRIKYLYPKYILAPVGPTDVLSKK